MNEQEQSQYRAFISHRCRGEGRQAAERLVKFLHDFRTPRAIRKKYPLAPPRLTPIFYSPDSLDSISLYDEMPQKLAASQFLIVVCTPDYAVPSPDSGICYADTATASFLGYPVSPDEPHGIPEAHIQAAARDAAPARRTHIIPVIFRDAAAGTTSEDCLPPLLDALHIVGPDTGVKSEEEVFLAVAARLLGLKDFQELHSRWKQAEQRRKAINQARIIFVAILTLCALVWSWSFFIPHYSYYADYVEKDNIPQGIHPLNKEQRSRRSEHYCITEQFHHITRIERLNAEGNPCQTPQLHGLEDRPASYDLTYDERDKKVTKHLCYDTHGKLIQERHFLGDDVLYFFPKQADNGARTSINGCAAFSMGPGDTFDQYRQKFQNIRRLEREVRNGLVQRVYYCNTEGAPLCDSNGVWGLQYRRDSAGRITSVTYLDKDKKPTKDTHGAMGCRYQYGANDELLTVTYVNSTEEQARATMGEWGWAKATYDYDKDGNPTTSKILSATNPDIIISQVTTRYEQAHAVEARTSGLSGSGYITTAYDSAGYAKDVRFYDAAGLPRPVYEDIARICYTYDDKANITSMHFYGTDLKTPCALSDGYASITITYDTRSNPKQMKFYDEKGGPCRQERQIARADFTFNGMDNNEEERYYDADDNPCIGPENYARAFRTYNTLHEQESESYFAYDAKLQKYLHCDNDKGYARVTYTRDPKEPLLTERYFAYDKERKDYIPCKNAEGYAVLRRRQGIQGFPQSESYYDTEDHPCLCNDGYAEIRWTYENGNKTSESYYEPDGNGTMQLLRHGCAMVKWTYDNNGNMTRLSFHDADGKLYTHPDGYALDIWTYDLQGRLISEEFFDENKQPCISSEGYSRAVYRYDTEGNPLPPEYYAHDMKCKD